MADKTVPESIRLRLSQMKMVKDEYEDRDYNIARYVNPRRELIRQDQKFDDKGEERGKMSYTGIPNAALSIWADGMQGHMVSQSLRWFKSVLDNIELNKNDEIQAYLQRYDEAMYAEFNKSNFYAILGEWFRDAGSIGTATLFTEEDVGNGVAVHIPIHPREIFISEDRYGNVDTVYREFFLTARQAVDIFGDEKLSKDVTDNAESHPEKRHEFIHAVYPNTDRMFNSILSIHKKYASVYIQSTADKISDKTLRSSGFDLNPYAVWRLRKNSDEIYGYSPAADAMVDIKSLNQMSRTLMKAAHMAVAPPQNVPEHMRGHTRLEPDGLNYYEKGGDKMTPVQTGVNFPIGIDRENKIQQIIEDKYRVEFFMILARAEREMTATEIMERQAEKAVLLGPQVDRLEQEGLAKVFGIVSDIAEKAGRFEELDPPQILRDAVEGEGKSPSIDIRFIGPLAQAQKRIFEMQPIKNGLNEIAQAATIFPKVLDKINPDRLSERILDSVGFPQDIMNSDDEVKAIRDQQAEDLAKAEALQQAQGMADAMPKLSKKPEEGSPAELIGQQLGV